MDIILIMAWVAYVTLGLVSVGYAVRSRGRHSWIEAFAVAMLWPLYWLVYVGPTEMLRRLMATFFTENGAVLVFALMVGYAFTAFMFPAYYIAKSWDACSGYDCVAVIAKAVTWAPFWPAYLLAAFTH